MVPSAQSPRLETLKKRSQFLFVRNGFSERRKSVVVQARRRTNSNTMGLGFTATKKIGNAVVRNRAKRRLRAAAASLLPLHGCTGCEYVFIARMDTATIGWQRLLDDMEAALITLAGRLSNPTLSA